MQQLMHLTRLLKKVAEIVLSDAKLKAPVVYRRIRSSLTKKRRNQKQGGDERNINRKIKGVYYVTKESGKARHLHLSN
jgi:hypothetical protein